MFQILMMLPCQWGGWRCTVVGKGLNWPRETKEIFHTKRHRGQPWNWRSCQRRYRFLGTGWALVIWWWETASCIDSFFFFIFFIFFLFLNCPFFCTDEPYNLTFFSFLLHPTVAEEWTNGCVVLIYPSPGINHKIYHDSFGKSGTGQLQQCQIHKLHCLATVKSVSALAVMRSYPF